MTTVLSLCRSTPKEELYQHYIRFIGRRQEGGSCGVRPWDVFLSRLGFRAAVPAFLGHSAAPRQKNSASWCRRGLSPATQRVARAVTFRSVSKNRGGLESIGKTSILKAQGLADVTYSNGLRSPRPQEGGTLPTRPAVPLKTLRVRLDPYCPSQLDTCATVGADSGEPSARGEMTRVCGRTPSSRGAASGDCTGRYGPGRRTQGWRRPPATVPCRRRKPSMRRRSIVGRQYPKTQCPVQGAAAAGGERVAPGTFSTAPSQIVHPVKNTIFWGRW